MYNYFTTAKTKETFFRCQKLEINTMIFRGDMYMLRLIHEFQREGGSLNWICMTRGEFFNFDGRINQIMQYAATAIYHHGSMTDGMFQAEN